VLDQFPEDIRANVDVPEFHPPFQSFVVGDNGSIIVSTFEEGDNSGEYMVDIFNEEGIFWSVISLNIYIWEGYLWARIKNHKFYCLEEKGSGYKILAVYNMIIQ
jgi:hypothetical protein